MLNAGSSPERRWLKLEVPGLTSGVQTVGIRRMSWGGGGEEVDYVINIQWREGRLCNKYTVGEVDQVINIQWGEGRLRNKYTVGGR